MFDDLKLVDIDKIYDLSDAQRLVVMGALGCPAEASEFDRRGMILTGENRGGGFVFQTGARIGGAQNCWEAVKNQVYLCFCTDSKIYSDIREKADKSFPALVSAIAVQVANVFNVGVAVIVGAVAVAVIAVFRIGKNAWCDMNSKNSGGA